jgi:N,N'-diacetyllegionaminate synthase
MTKVLVVAEIGVNHQGNLSTALRLTDAAKAAGADIVKLQHFSSRDLWGDDRIAHLELTDAEMQVVAKHCAYIGIEFLCTPFGVREVGVIAPLVKRLKVASGCLERPELLDAVNATGLPVIMSTGMADWGRVSRALGHLHHDVTLLHCTSAYPCPYGDVNLAAMDALRAFGTAVGYSDHTAGIIIALAAAARGAEVLEKHLTLDRNAAGPDHKASIEPDAFRIMVGEVRDIEAAIGDGVKRPQPSEAKTAEAWYGTAARP